MSAGPQAQPEQLEVAATVFAGDRFWAALTRLADQRGHAGHDRYLVGETAPTDRYAYYCVTCSATIVAFHVERQEPAVA